MRALAFAAALLAATPALAAERSFEVSGLIAAPPSEVFKVFTTAEGWKRLGVGFAVVDFRVGGTIETNYQANAQAGQRENIKNQVVAYVPGRLIVLRNVQAPPSFPYPEAFSRTATVFELTPEGSGTRMTVTGVGYGEGAAFDWLLKAFKVGDAETLKALADSYAGKPSAPLKSSQDFTKPKP
jgi:uncharacterized protein YndB with AHSA1/START domain